MDSGISVQNNPDSTSLKPGYTCYNVHGAQPSEEMILQTGDVLVLLGLPEALELARIRLHQGEI